MTSQKIAITSANIRSNPRQRFLPVRNRVARTARFPGFAIGQEVFASRRTRSRRARFRRGYMGIWINQMKLRGKATVGAACECPISFPSHGWDKQYSEIHHVHGGKKRVSEARVINELRTVAEVSKVRASILACHPVSKGYKTGWRARGVSAMGWRRARLAEYMAALHTFVQRALDNGCDVVIAGGDMNYPNAPKPHPRAVHIAHSRLDHLWAVPAEGWRITDVKTATVPRNRAMDHPIIHAEFTLVSDS